MASCVVLRLSVHVRFAIGCELICPVLGFHCVATIVESFIRMSGSAYYIRSGVCSLFDRYRAVLCYFRGSFSVNCSLA